MFPAAFPACGKGFLPLPLDHLLGETNPGTPGFGQRLPEERFVEDDYIKRERPKSILCAPITHQVRLERHHLPGK